MTSDADRQLCTFAAPTPGEAAELAEADEACVVADHALAEWRARPVGT